MEQVFNKLVRDNVPEIINNKGEKATTRILDDEEYRRELFKKLIEESNEVVTATKKDDIIEELGDVLEVMRAILELENSNLEEVINVSEQKKLKRGGFSKRVFLIKTNDNRYVFMNIDFIRDKFRFNARASALIYSKDQSKVLLFNVEGRSIYFLPGGRIEELEESLDTIKREIEEEIGWNNIDYSFLALSEEFVNAKGYDNHQINIIYKGIYKDEIDKIKFKGLEGDWINFEWADVDKIEEYNIFPSNIKDIILGKSHSNHFVNNLIKK